MGPVEELLCRESRGVLSLTGGGGKTSLMYHLARLLVAEGKRVLTTTTTRILAPLPEESATLIVAADPVAVLREAASHLHETAHVTVCAQRLEEADKLKGFPPEAIRVFAESGLFDWVIVEADGAARRPLKAPAGHEPVIPDVTTVVVAVAGLEVLGALLSEDLVFRSELAGPIMGLSPGETITETNLARLFAHPSGLFKGVPAAARRIVFLNKAETPGRRAGGALVAAELGRLAPSAAEAVLVGEARGRVTLHGVYPLGPPPSALGLPKVAGIILAAGEGSRMGRTKQLLPFRGKTILQCVVENALASGLHRVVVVLGHEAVALARLVAGSGADVVVNPDYRRGQSTSLRAGLAALSDDTDAALFLLGDQPLVSPRLIDTILSAYAASPHPIVHPTFQGERGNPVLFDRETFPRLAALTGDQGARPLFGEYADRLLAVAVDDPAIHLDVDTAEEYEQLLRMEG